MDFKALVTAQLNSDNAESQLKDLCKDRNVNLKVSLTGDVDILKNIQKQLNSNAQNLGKQTATMYSEGIKSVKLDGFFRDTFKQNKKDLDKAQKLVDKYQNKSYAPSEKEALKAVKAKRNAEEKVNKEAQKQQENLRKQEEKLINDIENKRIASFQKRQEEERKIEKAQADAINKELETSYKKQQKQQENLRKQEEVNRRRALDYTKNASSRLNDAINKYDYGDNAEATKLAKQLNRGLSNFGNLSDVEGTINSIEQKVFSTISTLQKSHESNLKLINEEIQAEKNLQSQRDVFNKSNLNGIDLEIKKREENAKLFSSQLKAQMEEEAKSLVSLSSMQEKYENYATRLSSLKITDTSKFENASAYQKMTNYIKDAENAMSRFNAEKEKGGNANFNVLTKEMKEVESATKKAETQYKNLYAQINKLDGITASNKAFSWLSNHDKVYKDENLSSAIENIANQLKDVTYQGELDSLQRKLNSYITQAQASGLSGKSGISMFKQSFVAIAQFTGIYGLLQNVVEEIPRLMAQAVIDIDDSITELRKVSDASESSISEYFDEATESAKKYGQTISDVIASTADWSRLGYNLKEAKQLSDVTTLYQNVGDNMTQESASESLVSTLQGFKLNADQAQHIVDAFNEVGNNFAIGSDGIGEALQRSASSMYAAGNTMEETIGLITATNEVVQDPASVGTAFKTISMRIRGAKTELEEAGLETDGMVESTAKLREEIMALSGVDIMKDKNTFKSTYEILGQLADKWQDLTDIQQASITELIAGKRQGNIISALMNNFNTAREATETAMNSDGSALKENEKYMDSISGKIGKFKAQFQEFSSATLDSEVFKGVVDSGTALLNVLTEIISVGNGVPALLTTIGGISFFKHLD